MAVIVLLNTIATVLSANNDPSCNFEKRPNTSFKQKINSGVYWTKFEDF